MDRAPPLGGQEARQGGKAGQVVLRCCQDRQGGARRVRGSKIQAAHVGMGLCGEAARRTAKARAYL